MTCLHTVATIYSVSKPMACAIEFWIFGDVDRVLWVSITRIWGSTLGKQIQIGGAIGERTKKKSEINASGERPTDTGSHFILFYFANEYSNAIELCVYARFYFSPIYHFVFSVHSVDWRTGISAVGGAQRSHWKCINRLLHCKFFNFYNLIEWSIDMTFARFVIQYFIQRQTGQWVVSGQHTYL